MCANSYGTAYSAFAARRGVNEQALCGSLFPGCYYPCADPQSLQLMSMQPSAHLMDRLQASMWGAQNAAPTLEPPSPSRSKLTRLERDALMGPPSPTPRNLRGPDVVLTWDQVGLLVIITLFGVACTAAFYWGF